jgi:hypothetical protein
VSNARAAEDLNKPLNHPERGDMALRVVIETMGGHDLNHFQCRRLTRSSEPRP